MVLNCPNRAVAEYRRTEIQCGTPLELVVRLYDAMLCEVARASAAMRAGDMRAKRDALSRSLAILGELQSSLDLRQGREIAVSLDSLYTYAMARLTEANVRRDAGALDEVHALLVPLRDAWRQIASQQGRGGVV
ncbi:MAG: flagellar export chaperone FliS [Acidobacteriota bacterium]